MGLLLLRAYHVAALSQGGVSTGKGSASVKREE